MKSNVKTIVREVQTARAPKESIAESVDSTLRDAARADATAIRTYLILHYASGLISKKVDQHLAQWGLSTARYAILRFLEGQEPVTLSWLSKSHVCVAGNMTSLVARLQRDGLVRCTTDPADRRVTRVALTAKGDKLVRSAVEAHRGFVSELMSAVSSADLNELASAVDKIAARASTLGK